MDWLAPLVRQLADLGGWAPFLFVLLYVVAAITLAPSFLLTFAAGALALDVSAAGAHGARSAVLGVRPEHITIAAGAPLAGTVKLVEPMGNHQILWIDAAGHLVSALVHDDRAFAAGQPVAFAIDASRVSLFDPVSEQRL